MRRAALLVPAIGLAGPRPAFPRLPVPARVRNSRAWAFAAREPWLMVLVVAAATAYGVYSIIRHSHFNSLGWDLGIFDQAIWHYSRFEAPESTLVGRPSLLGDHFHPILLLLVPLYWIRSDPAMLLGAQAVLLAASIVPVWLYVRDKLGRRPAYLMAAAYSAFWGIHSAVDFDFHEIAFAPLVTALLLLFAERRQWRRYFIALVALLLIKENLALLAVAIAAWLVTQRAYRQALITAVAGLAWFFITVNWLIPMFAGDLPFRHWTYPAFGTDLPSSLYNIARDPTLLFEVLVTPGTKVDTMILLFLPFLFMGLLSPLALLYVPLILERMLSVNPWHWTTMRHYSLVIAPIIVLASADGIRRVARRLPERRPRTGRIGRRLPTFAAACAGLMLAANLYISSGFPMTRNLLDPDFYRPTSRDIRLQRAIARIPPDASVTAQFNIVSHLSQRDDIFELGPNSPTAEYLVADVDDYFSIVFPTADYRDRQFFFASTSSTYEQIFRDGDVVVMRRRSAGERAAIQEGRPPG